MTFTARLKRHSNIWNMWRGGNRTGGVVAQVQFRWVPGDNYVTDTLAPAQVTALRAVPDVVIEAVEVFPSSEVIEPIRQEVPTPRQTLTLPAGAVTSRLGTKNYPRAGSR
jgi:hypothetical protein